MHFFDNLYLLVTFLLSARFSASIRVDWNTNKGPIIPPTPRSTQRPQQPYRAPAPVWEDQSDDIPNPNPYVYVLPPPSRPRPATNNYLTADRRPVTQDNYHLYNKQQQSYSGNLLPPQTNAANYYQNENAAVVAGLAPKYIPNVGFKYFAIVPNNNNNNNNNYNYNNNNNKNAAALNLSNGYHIANDNKVQGKFNAKTKKYKAFEKVKYVPQPSYYPFYEFALPDVTPYLPIFDAKAFISTQQLPALQTERSFNEKIWTQSLEGKTTYEVNEAFGERETAASEMNTQTPKQPTMQLRLPSASSSLSSSSSPPSTSKQLNQIHDYHDHSPKIAYAKDDESHMTRKENFGKFAKKLNYWENFANNEIVVKGKKT